MNNNKPLIVILAVLTVSVLLTGGLAVYLTLAREGGGTGDVAAEPTVMAEPTAVYIVPSEPHIAFVSAPTGASISTRPGLLTVSVWPT
jgi:hypothetical protein